MLKLVGVPAFGIDDVVIKPYFQCKTGGHDFALAILLLLPPRLTEYGLEGFARVREDSRNHPGGRAADKDSALKNELRIHKIILPMHRSRDRFLSTIGMDLIT